MEQRAMVRAALTGLPDFSRLMLPDHALRPYQSAAAEAIIRAVRAGAGGQFAIVFARQAGKDKLIAQMLAYLLALYQRKGGRIIVAQPTYKPQGLIARTRLIERLHNPLGAAYKTDADGGLRLGRATVRYVSADPNANARGETASLLLLANEAQDIAPDHWDAVFDPMGASTNAVTVFSGTMWTSRTLLARQIRYLRALEADDGMQRVFLADWRTVAAHVPAYGERVRARIAQLGAEHPFIKSEYDLTEIDADGALFNPTRVARMAGSHERKEEIHHERHRDTEGREEEKMSPQRSQRATKGEEKELNRRNGGQETGGRGETFWGYVLCVDVAGEDELGEGAAVRQAHTRRDSTAATLFAVYQHPDGLRYRVMTRYLWTGAAQTAIYERLVALAEAWRLRRLIVDATGVGAGVAAFLVRRLGERVVTGFVFSSASKSRLGWTFLGIVDSGRYQDYAGDGAEETRLFWQQVRACGYSVRNDGASRLLRWSVADPTVHDDLLISAALVAQLEMEQDGPARGARIARAMT